MNEIGPKRFSKVAKGQIGSKAKEGQKPKGQRPKGDKCQTGPNGLKKSANTKVCQTSKFQDF